MEVAGLRLKDLWQAHSAQAPRPGRCADRVHGLERLRRRRDRLHRLHRHRVHGRRRVARRRSRDLGHRSGGAQDEAHSGQDSRGRPSFSHNHNH